MRDCNDKYQGAAERILPYIGVGRENAVKRRFLRTMSGLGDRAMRKGIERLREDYPIVNMQDGAGYYLTYDPSELLRFIKQQHSRAVENIASTLGAEKELEKANQEKKYEQRRAVGACRPNDKRADGADSTSGESREPRADVV